MRRTVASAVISAWVATAAWGQSPSPGGVKGPLSKDTIADTVHEHRPQIRACYQARAQAKPKLAGKVVVRFLIGNDGAVAKASVESSTAGDSQLEACVANAVRSWKFPKPKRGPVEVNFPFTLGPERSADAGTALVPASPGKKAWVPPDPEED